MEAEQRQGSATQPVTVEARKDNFLTLLQKWPLRRKIATLAVLLFSVGLFAILIIQARIADQQLLYANLTTSDASNVTAWLKNQNIPFSLKNGGKDIWASADQIYQIRLDLAAEGMPSGGGVGFEVFDKQSFALTDYVQKVNYTRALQGELARTITSLAPVESTRVHLALPEKRLFKNQQKAASASVIITLIPGKTLDQKQVQGIVHLVAGSVTDLEAENVKVIDSNGMVLDVKQKSDDDRILSVDMLAFQQEVEHRMEMRVQDLLDKTMGKDNGMVRISAALDFSKVEKTQELFDGDDPVIRSEQVNQESNGMETTGGIPGVQSNLQGNEFGQTDTVPPSNKQSRTTNYEISKTISKIVNPVGSVKTLSVSVLVADRVTFNEGGAPVSTEPRSAEELKSIEDMVSTALGLVTDRGDMINVLSMPFVNTEKNGGDEAPLPNNMLYEYVPFIKYGLIALSGLLIYFMLLRPVIKTMKGETTQHYKTVQQMEKEQRQSEQEEPEEPPLPVDESLTALRRDVMKNHVPAAYILKNWIQEG